MKCKRLANESKNIAKNFFKDYKFGIKQLGILLQHCDTGHIKGPPPLLVEQYHSFKKSMQRSIQFTQQAIDAAEQATVMEHRLFTQLNIQLSFWILKRKS